MTGSQLVTPMERSLGMENSIRLGKLLLYNRKHFSGDNEDLTERGTPPEPPRLTTYDTFKSLPRPTSPYTSDDFEIVRQILAAATDSSDSDSPVNLPQVLHAYELVLSQYSIDVRHDTRFYRILLKLSFDAEHDWFAALARERKRLKMPAHSSCQQSLVTGMRRWKDTHFHAISKTCRVGYSFSPGMWIVSVDQY